MDSVYVLLASGVSPIPITTTVSTPGHAGIGLEPIDLFGLRVNRVDVAWIALV